MGKRPVVELEELRNRLREAEETLSAIRNGEVDSLVVTGPQGDQVFSLKGAEAPYRIFVEQMLEGAVTLNASGMVLYCNRRFAEMVRTPLEKVIGSQIEAYLREADRAEVLAILQSPEKRKTRYVLNASDGSFISAQLAFSKMPMDDDVEAVCVVVTDLTEREEKQELAAALQNLKLAQEQLQQQNDELARARAAAEEANDAKDNFLAALSHELRTPLTPVLMTVAAMEADSSLSATMREDLSTLRRNVELEARLIDDLLDLTRIARGKIELKSGVIDVHMGVSGALGICRSDIDAKRLILVTELGAKETNVEGDVVRVQQILWNLIRNAVKFTPEGGKITVRSRNEGGQIAVDIVDTGIGIEPEVISRIFTPFEQADRFITRQFGGLGLGLTISRRLAELHGGTLVAQSGGRYRGSTFTLLLPVVHARVPAQPVPQVKPEGSQKASQLRILLVEDHADTRRSMARLLGRQHQVCDVGSVEGALQAAGKQRFDLVISDLGLPDGSGLDLMRELRKQYGLEGICLSGFGMEEDLERSADAGFRHHLTKPIELAKLESVINTFVSAPARS